MIFRVIAIQIVFISLLFGEETFESLSIKLFVDDENKRSVEKRPFGGGTINLHNQAELTPPKIGREQKSIIGKNYNYKNRRESSDKLKEAFMTPLHSIEVGFKYRPVLYTKYQEDLFADSHLIEFYSSWDMSFAPYLLLKSKAFRFENIESVGWFFKHSFDYYSFSEQKGVYSSGKVDSDSVDLGTELSIYSWSFLPTAFFYIDLDRNSQNNRNRVVFEASGGAGLSILDGKYTQLQYPTQSEFDASPSSYQMLGSRQVLVGGTGSYDFEMAFHLIYNFTLKYMYDSYTFHISFENPLIFKDNYWNTTLLSIGAGYSF